MLNLHQGLHIKGILCLLLLGLLAGCASPYPQVSDDFEKNWTPKSYAAQVYLIPDASQALAHRVALIQQATDYIEMTYFSWDKDSVGLTLLDEIKNAADRGVAVRLVLDDLLVFNEQWLAQLAQHDKIDIRIFNPFHSRNIGWLGRAADFQRHHQRRDHRMHEKYFNVDGKTMILGGRNIGEAYFGYSQHGNFFDLDAMFQGDVIAPFEQHYRTLWTSDAVTPISTLIASDPSDQFEAFNHELDHSQSEREDVVAHLDHTLRALPAVEYVSAVVTPIFDSLAKQENSLPYLRTRLESTLSPALEGADNVVISSPYLIPNSGHFDAITALAQNGVALTVVTNSMASNDSGFVPAYYQTRRDTLLDMDVQLFELKRHAQSHDHFIDGQTYYHNKALIIDKQVSFIGSSNFDPRSDFLNFELGVVIESAAFAKQLHEYLLDDHTLYWQVAKKDGQLFWTDEETTQDSDPEYGTWHTLPNWILRQMKVGYEL